MHTLRFPERRKKPGVHYAVTTDGVELPIIDITHPAFALSVSEPEQRAHVAAFMREDRSVAAVLRRLPAPVRTAVTRLMLRGSLLAPGLERADRAFLDGMTTYMVKLGPQNLGGAYAKPVDRRIVAALPSLAMRWRLQDMARLVADVLLAADAAPGARAPIHLLNIAGGPALDSLNALLLVHRERPARLVGRPVTVTVLDGDEKGPAFGAQAFAAWSAPDGPFHGVETTFRHVPFDWRRPETLSTVVEAGYAAGAQVVMSSEGGLFEYGSDDDIVENLTRLRACTGSDVAVVGSVTRDDELMKRFRRASTPATHPRGLPRFRALVERAGFEVARAIERPFSDHVMMVPSRR